MVDLLTRTLENELRKKRFRKTVITRVNVQGSINGQKPRVAKALVESGHPNPNSGQPVKIIVSASLNEQGKAVIDYNNF